MPKICAYITFQGNCREAMTFYSSVFGGQTRIQTVKGSPMESQWPVDVRDKVLHASVSNEELEILGSDMAGPGGLHSGNFISLVILCRDDEEQNAIFARLSEGGKILYPLHDFYDGRMGGVTDKFGVNWILKQ